MNTNCMGSVFELEEGLTYAELTLRMNVKNALHYYKDRFALVEPVVGKRAIDIRFRMLQPHELAAAHGMQDFTFFGNKGNIVKQIGNSVPREMARALCKSVLRRYAA